jgi:hypothetical protein
MGRPFAETLQNMSTAFEAACEKLGLVVKHDPATEAIAGGNAGAIWPRVQKAPRS